MEYNMPIISPPPHTKHILNILEKNGHAACLAGGCVRDILMGAEPNDWDIATSAKCEDVIRIFPHTVPTGIKYGTVTVFHGNEKAEVTTFRRDGEYADSRRPQNVTFVSALEEDLKRRDFTVNAMAMNAAGQITDLFGGREDIENRLIRCVGIPQQRFEEDALRMLRAFRFSATLGFDIEENTLLAIETCADSAKNLSAERVSVEILKIITSDRPEIAGNVINFGLLDSFVIKRGIEVSELSKIAKLPKDSALRLSAFCAVLLKRGIISNPETFLKSLRFSKKAVTSASVGALTALSPFPRDKIGIKKLISQIGETAALCAASASYVINGGGDTDIVNAIINSGECVSVAQLDISGDDLINLGISGVFIGQALNALLEHVIANPAENRRDILIGIARNFKF